MLRLTDLTLENTGAYHCVASTYLMKVADWTRLADTPECWSLEFQLDAIFGDNLGHICRQIMVYLQIILSYEQNYMEKWIKLKSSIQAFRGTCMPGLHYMSWHLILIILVLWAVLLYYELCLSELKQYWRKKYLNIQSFPAIESSVRFSEQKI